MIQIASSSITSRNQGSYILTYPVVLNISVQSASSVNNMVLPIAHQRRMFMFAIVLALLIVLSGCSSAQPTGPDAARALIDESAAAMGGWAAINAVKSHEIITAGADLEPMQAVKPDGEPRTINRFSQGIIVDFEKQRMRLTFD